MLHQPMTKRFKHLLVGFIAIGTAVLPFHASAADKLPGYAAGAASVSGLSSGGFMAVQLHVAYSGEFVDGVGVVAGGPFYCAEGLLSNATGRCMDAQIYGSPPTSTLISITNNWSSNGYIDPVGNLSGDRVYLFTGGRYDSGTHDTTVDWRVMDEAYNYYKNYTATGNIIYKSDLRAEHAMITDYYGNSCGYNGPPYINNCGFDLAGAMLKHLTGAATKNTGTLTGTFVEFDQREFIASTSMADTGWAYVPKACAESTTCKVHVALHGCKQNYSHVGDAFIRNTGYNPWADGSNIIVLYPQTGTGATNGCWDWWGYLTSDYARKTGPQMQAIKAMVDRLQSPRSAPGTGTTVTFSSIGSDDGYVKAYADGSYPDVGTLTAAYMGRGTDSKFNRTVLSFDTSAIPDGATITRAYLTVTYAAHYGDPWANPSGNTLVIDVKNGIFGSYSTMEKADWSASTTAAAVATIAKFTSGAKQSSDFSAAGLSAINKTGKTQLRLRFSSNQSTTSYVGIGQGSGATLTVVYQ